MSESNNWIKAAGAETIRREDILRWDHDGKSYAIYRTRNDEYFATNDICTHEFARLSDGYLDGTTIECPRHAGCFDIRTGKALNPPVCVNVQTYPVKIIDGAVFLDVSEDEG